ncbi:MAG TPA: glycosyltransferase, partial [Gammaproteobacteria bacterium]|nr:glycosyltransferase [Gammaproteobacteria bacterium]
SVSVVIPLYNDAETIECCLTSVLSQSIEGELDVVVVDDGSTDIGPELARKFPINLVQQKNTGPAAARNAGASIANGELLIFLDADCIVGDGWAAAMIEPFAEKDVVAAMGAIESQENGLVPSLIQIEIEERYRRLSQRRYVDFFAPVVVAFRRDYFLSLGGFRVDFRYNEDVELAYRINSRNDAIVFVSSPRAAHLHPSRWRDYFLMKYWRGVWRMRLYRLYPKKAANDDWTPNTLKLQAGLTLLLPVMLVGAAFVPMIMWGVLLLLGILCWSAKGMVAYAYKKPGVSLALAIVPFVMLRSLALAAAVLTNVLKPMDLPKSHLPSPNVDEGQK